MKSSGELSSDKASMPPIDVSDKQWAIIEGILQRLVPGVEVWAFGSRAAWTAKAFSDLDLALVSEDHLPGDIVLALKSALEEAPLPFRVDVVELSATTPKFRKIIESTKVVLLEKRGGLALRQTGWSTSRIDSLAVFNPEQIGPKYQHRVIQYLDIANAAAGAIESLEEMELGEAPSRARRIVRDGDTIISTVRPGNRAYVYLQAPPENMIVSTGYAVLRAIPTRSDPRFLYYVVTQSSVIDYLAAIAEEKTAYPSVNPKDIAEITVLTPPLPEQRAIAHVLGTLDDKIELNRRMNKTLEEIARTLFRAWFVDFEPVRAKMEGRTPVSCDVATAALFPDRLVESELGEIPEGWEVGTIGDIGLLAPDRVKPGEVDAGTPYFGLEHMPRASIALDDWGYASDAASQKSAFRTGDVLFGKLRPYFHKVGVAPLDGICSTDIVVVRAKAPKFLGLLTFWLASPTFVDAMSAASTGTRMPRTNWKDMASYSIPLPPAKTAAVFTALAQPMIQLIRSNIFESRTLAELRDTLLPKLLSGELRVPVAEEMVEAAI